jgi:hypothetical protein
MQTVKYIKARIRTKRGWDIQVLANGRGEFIVFVPQTHGAAITRKV